jgi:hypothetical protein
MKLFIKMMIFFVILAFAGPYLLMGPDGMQRLMAIKDFGLPSFDFSLPSLDSPQDLIPGDKNSQQWIQWAEEKAPAQPDQLTRDQLAMLEIQAQENIYYRWQDDSGVWQFSELPNRNTLNLVVRTDPNANVLQGLSEEQIDVALGRFKPPTNSIVEGNPMANGEGLDNEIPIPTTIPVTEIPKLIEQAKDVQKLMEDRVKNMDKMLGDT